MSRDLDQLLKDCMAGLDSGLTPEECLSAWPEQRAELEPMLRQAILLRMAFASVPSEEFRSRAKEKLMFAAGKEAQQAFSAEPAEDFTRRARQRLLQAAGSSAQESLRAVPPPRLAFWMNARRRLLESASGRTASMPAPRPMALAFRTGLSMAVVALAIAVAGIAYFANQTSKPTPVNAELAEIEQQLSAVEEQWQAGNPVPPNVLVDVTAGIAAAIEKLDPQEAPAPVVAKANDLIERGKGLVQQAQVESPVAPPALQEAQQQLSQAEERVRVLAARADSSPVPQATSISNTPVPAAATAAASSTAAATATSPAVSPTVVPIGSNQIRLRPLPGDTTFGLSWQEVATSQFRMAIPANWLVVGPEFDDTGLADLEDSRLRIQSPDAQILLGVEISSGTITAFRPNEFSLREATSAGGETVSLGELLAKAGPFADELSHLLQTVVHTPPTPTPTPSPTATPTPRPVATPITEQSLPTETP